MDDLISRQAAIEEIAEFLYYSLDRIESTMGDFSIADWEWKLGGILQDIPSAQPERTGKWINRSLNIVYPEWERYTCSVCGKHSDGYDFCPHCGARMEE